MWRSIPLAKRRNWPALFVVPLFVFQVFVFFCQIAPASPGSGRAEKPALRLNKGADAASKIKPLVNNANPTFTFGGVKEVDGLLLKQEFRFIGKSTTYFSPLGISLQSSTLSVLFNSKTLVMCIFSDDTKKFYACDPETWKKKSTIMFKGDAAGVKYSPWKFERNETVAGMKTKVFSRYSYMKTSTNLDTVWVTDDIRLGPDARNLMFSMLKVTAAVPEGVPLRHAISSKHQKMIDKSADFLGRHRVRQMRDQDEVDYQTFSIQKVKIPVSKYVMPKGYKRAESEMEVFFNTEDAMGGVDVPDLSMPDPKKRPQEKFR